MPVDIHEVNRIRPVKEMVENDLRKLPGVNGVDIGLKEVKGERTETHCIIVYVAEKGNFKEKDKIPETIEGIQTDIVEATFEYLVATTETEKKLEDPEVIDSARYDPVQGGAQIGAARFKKKLGSVGCLVTDNSTEEKLWLSCYHVMCVDKNWHNKGVNKAITQQSIGMGASTPADDIGNILRAHNGRIRRLFAYSWYVDCAVSTSGGRAASASIIEIGAPKGAKNANNSSLVTKYGSRSKRTYGVIESTNMSLEVDGIWYYYQLRIEPPHPGDQPFSLGGDSGAIVVDTDDFYAVGMIFAGDGKISVANPINAVIGALDVSIP